MPGCHCRLVGRGGRRRLLQSHILCVLFAPLQYDEQSLQFTLLNGLPRSRIVQKNTIYFPSVLLNYKSYMDDATVKVLEQGKYVAMVFGITDSSGCNTSCV